VISRLRKKEKPPEGGFVPGGRERIEKGELLKARRLLPGHRSRSSKKAREFTIVYMRAGTGDVPRELRRDSQNLTIRGALRRADRPASGSRASA
jgi:hypothetical protein